ncbi:MAG: hypothetical protein ACJ8R9_11275 [Steroidobacteraceae bacterium]
MYEPQSNVHSTPSMEEYLSDKIWQAPSHASAAGVPSAPPSEHEPETVGPIACDPAATTSAEPEGHRTTSPETAAPSLNKTRRRPKPDPKACFWRRTYSYHGVHLQHVLHPGGILQRHVVIDSAHLRQLLGQPRRRAIAALNARQEHFELRTSELWELAESEALPSLQRIYAEAHRTSETLREERRRPSSLPRKLTSDVDPTDWHEAARGILLQGQEGEGGRDYNLYLWDPETLKLLRISGSDLKRAWQKSKARLGETIQVIPRGEHSVPIEEERSGTHGEGRRTLHPRRVVFDIYRVSSRAHLVTDEDSLSQGGTS